MPGITSYGVYLPRGRLARADIGAVLGAGGGSGSRTIAGYDEDTTSMAVEAARIALRARQNGNGKPMPVEAVVFSTIAPAYLDKSNAATVHAALRLDREAGAVDAHGSGRSLFGALRLSVSSSAPTLVVGSEIRAGLAGGTDESQAADAAVAFVTGTSGTVAELVSAASETDELLDRWQLPGERSSRVWEERFAEQILAPMARRVADRAIEAAGVSLGDVDRIVVGGTHRRTVRRVKDQLAAGDRRQADPADEIGDAGAVGAGVGLAAALDAAEREEWILVLVISDGADAFMFRTTQAVESKCSLPTVAEQLKDGRPIPYARYLTWRGLLEREPPRRPDPPRPSAPPSHRAERWKFAFVGSECRTCGGRYLPPQRTCLKCGAVDQMNELSFAERTGLVTTYTVDRLTYSPSPPVIAAVVDFKGGGRFSCELTDVDPEDIRIGTEVEMTFRRLYTAGGVHNYFWKSRPVKGEVP